MGEGETDLARLRLIRSPRIGPVAYRQLIARFGSADAALDALPRHLSGTGYFPLGLPVLREAVARWYAERGTPTNPDQVLVTTGAQQAIHLLITAHAGPGDRVVVEQFDPDTGELAQIVLTIEQLEELRAALNLPEGNYRLERR